MSDGKTTPPDDSEQAKICCGESVTTPFCPHCGKKGIVLIPPLVELLKHLKKILEGYLSFPATINHREKSGEWRPDFAAKKRSLNKATVAKWQRWIEAVEKAISDQTGGGS